MDDMGATPLTPPTDNSRTGARRRFIRGAGAVIPVVLTVNARSALAATCLSPSASASIDLLHSRPNRTQESCSGRTPGYWKEAWKTHPTEWGLSGGEGVLFSSVFGSGYDGKALKEVMDLKGYEDPYELGAHLCAAYLNYKMGWVPTSVLDLSDLIAMWNGRNTGYSPISGVVWYGADIVTYLKAHTMPL